MIVARHLTVRGYGLQICTLSIKINGYMATASNLRRHTVGWSTATGYGPTVPMALSAAAERACCDAIRVLPEILAIRETLNVCNGH